MKQQKVYIVILNWNGFEDTSECLKSLLVSSLQSYEIQIVLVDNASANDEGKRLKAAFSEIYLIENVRNEGFAEGNNVAFRYCLAQKDCDFIMLLNNDTVVEKEFLKPLLDFINKHPRSIVSPKLLYYDRPDTIQTMGGKLFLGGTINLGEGNQANKFDKVSSPDFLSGACYMATKEAFREIGLFDAKYFAYLEDLDWCLLARKKGYKLFVIPESVVYHKHSKSTRGSYFKAYLIVRNNIYFAEKHFKGFKRYAFIFSHLCIGLILNLKRYKSLRFLEHFWKGIKDGLRGM